MSMSIDEVIWIWPTAGKDGTTNGSESDLSYTLTPFFNYISKDYNNKIKATQDHDIYGRKELKMPSPYTESGDLSDTQKNSTLYKKLTILPIGWDANEENPTSPSPRKVFIDNITPIRNETWAQYFKNIVLANDASVAASNASVKKDTAFEDYGGRYPQHIRISLSGNSMKPNTDGFLSPMVTKGLMPLFLTHLTQRSMISSGQHGINYINLNSYPNKPYLSNMLHSAYAIPSIAPSSIEPDQYLNSQEIEDIIEDLIKNYPTYLLVVGNTTNTYSFFTQETLFYQIEKYRVGTNTPVQTFYCSVLSKDGTSIEFVDTQVLPEVEYEYVCYAWDLNNSSGTPITSFNSGFVDANFFIAKSPEPIFSQTVKIEQPPLPTPQVSFSNIKYSKNEIMIHLGLSTNSENGGFYEMKAGERADLEARESLYDLHGTKDRFVYETQTANFELYRLNEHPRRHVDGIYDDYRDIISNAQKIKTIEGDFGSSTATFIDKLYYNPDGSPKKYYYVFRCINEYGHPSNPTPIWEVEFMYKDLPNLGIAEESIWSEKDADGSFKEGGKRFKIRLSSNDTGRKIDFNLRFIMKKNYTQ